MHVKIRYLMRTGAACALAAIVLALAPGGRPGAQAQELAQEKAQAKTETAIFAGGCFWCMEGPFDRLDGVISTTSGYTGGRLANPTYQQVSYDNTGHAEAVKVVFDPAKISYEKLLDVFWRNVNPFVKDRQFCDVGNQYRTGIFVTGPAQRQAAQASLAKVQARFAGKTIYTEITDAGPFYDAEDYHQNFYLTHPAKYKFYRWNCGRDQRLKDIWGGQAEHGQ